MERQGVSNPSNRNQGHDGLWNKDSLHCGSDQFVKHLTVWVSPRHQVPQYAEAQRKSHWLRVATGGLSGILGHRTQGIWIVFYGSLLMEQQPPGDDAVCSARLYIWTAMTRLAKTGLIQAQWQVDIASTLDLPLHPARIAEFSCTRCQPIEYHPF